MDKFGTGASKPSKGSIGETQASPQGTLQALSTPAQVCEWLRVVREAALTLMALLPLLKQLLMLGS